MSVKKFHINKYINEEIREMEDLLAVESPLQISLKYLTEQKIIEKDLVITMRTPGQDVDLAIGYLYSEGIIKSYSEVLECSLQDNQVTIHLHKMPERALDNIKRNDYASAACGMCGKESMEDVYFPEESIRSEQSFDIKLVTSLSDKLKPKQALFQQTGGIHASALFDKDGHLMHVAEDIGRHNSLDKAIGWAIAEDEFPLSNSLLLVSGRAGFELIQKTIVAQIPVMVAVGAPSSMAVEYAESYGLTLVGFVKNNSFNVYSGRHRIH